MNDHSGEIFVHSVKQVKYIQADFYSVDDIEQEPSEKLALMVNEAIKEGWEPVGTPVWEPVGTPVYAGRDEDMPVLIQMMVKR